jgi:hypothetical protein
MDIDSVKNCLLIKELFNIKDLDTLKVLKNVHRCDACNLKKHDYAILECCSKRICSSCIDDLFDFHIRQDNELFICSFCQKKVFDIQIQI